MSSKAVDLAAFCVLFLLGATLPAEAAGAPAQANALVYPKSDRVDSTDLYHGVSVKDPYRWLESSDSAKTRAWEKEENDLTRSYLDRIPARSSIASRLKELWNYGRCDLPEEDGACLFYTFNTGLENQSVLYVQEGGKKRRVLVDPNTISKDGTVNLTSFEASRDSRYVAYGLSSSGSDWEDWYCKDVRSGATLGDHLRWLKNAHAVWSFDSKGVFYSRFDQPKGEQIFSEANYYQKVFYHRLGTDQSDDQLVFERKDQREWYFSPLVSDDGRYLIIIARHGTSRKNGVYIKDLSAPQNGVVELYPPQRAMFMPIGNDGSKFFFLTDENAPTAKIIAVNAIFEKDKVRGEKIDLIKAKDETLVDAVFVNGKFLCNYLIDAASAVSVFDQEGKFQQRISLPGVGSVGGFSARQSDREAYFSYESFTAPPTVFKFNAIDNTLSVFFQPQLRFNPQDYITERIFCASQDGTKVPVFVCYKKGLVLDGSNPTYLYGYGGFKISMTPSFSPSDLLWMERGGVYALAVLRGGGEYGEMWHESGMKLNKQRVFDDFVAAAQGLISKNYTASSRLSIAGRSNGGLLVGACITQHPELYAAAVAQVGVMDMLRYNLFTIGWGWQQEYGSPDDEQEFKALYRYSPLHNIKDGVCYPATLITTADHDDRVVPGHSFKFAAALQSAQSCDKPILLRIESKAGHGYGHSKSTSKLIDEATDKWAFLTKVLNVEPRTIARN